MRILLVTQQFPSLEHPYISDWVGRMWEREVELNILAESTDGTQGHSSFPGDRVRYRCRVSDLGSDLWANRGQIARLALHPKETGTAVRSLSDQSGDRWRRLVKLYEYIPVLSDHFDLVHFNNPQIAVRRYELGKLWRAKTLVSFRGQDFTQDPERYTSLVERTDHVHFLSHHLLEEARKAGYSGRNYTIIPPMVDTGFYTPPSQARPAKGRDSQFVLFTAARFAWQKGWEYALSAVALLRERGWKVDYYLAGEGDFKDAIVYTAYELGISEHVHRLGWLSPAEIREWMHTADLYVLASVNEAFNNSVLQAQSCGLPVVCSEAGGLAENIEDGLSGLLAHRRDAWDLADKIETLLSQPERRVRMGTWGRERIERYFRLEDVAERFIALYREICQET